MIKSASYPWHFSLSLTYILGNFALFVFKCLIRSYNVECICKIRVLNLYLVLYLQKIAS